MTITIRAALLMKPASCMAADMTTPGVVLHLRDVTGVIVDSFTAYWMGTPAQLFLNTHCKQLTAGRCLDLQLFRLLALNAELIAQVSACDLAPLAPSWVKHEVNQTATEAAAQS